MLAAENREKIEPPENPFDFAPARDVAQHVLLGLEHVDDHTVGDELAEVVEKFVVRVARAYLLIGRLTHGVRDIRARFAGRLVQRERLDKVRQHGAAARKVREHRLASAAFVKPARMVEHDQSGRPELARPGFDQRAKLAAFLSLPPSISVFPPRASPGPKLHISIIKIPRRRLKPQMIKTTVSKHKKARGTHAAAKRDVRAADEKRRPSPAPTDVGCEASGRRAAFYLYGSFRRFRRAATRSAFVPNLRPRGEAGLRSAFFRRAPRSSTGCAPSRRRAAARTTRRRPRQRLL